MTKVIEVISNVLSIASNRELSLWVKVLIVLVVAAILEIIGYYKKNGSIMAGTVVVLVIVILIAVSGENKDCSGPNNTPSPQSTKNITATPTVTESPSVMPTENAPTAISIQEANVLNDDKFYCGDGSEQDAYGNVYDSYVWTVMGGVDLSNDGTQSEIYLLQGKYSHFMGKLFVSNDDSSDNTFIMKIYLDGVEKYKSEIIKKDMKAWSFDYDITGANKVKVEFCMVDGDASMESGMYKETRAYLADGMFVK